MASGCPSTPDSKETAPTEGRTDRGKPFPRKGSKGVDGCGGTLGNVFRLTLSMSEQLRCRSQGRQFLRFHRALCRCLAQQTSPARSKAVSTLDRKPACATSSRLEDPASLEFPRGCCLHLIGCCPLRRRTSFPLDNGR